MSEKVLDDIPFVLPLPELLKQLHLDSESDEAAEVAEIAEQARAIGRPKAMWRQFPVEPCDRDHVRIGGIVFQSRPLAYMLNSRESVYAYCATCGAESDALLDPVDPLRTFWANEIRTSMLRQAMDFMRDELKKELPPEAKLTGMSPGSGETEQVWSICALRDLFALVNGEFTTRLGVELTESCLMLPAKTVAGILFVSAHDFASCRICKREKCPNRVAPFDSEVWAEVYGREYTAAEDMM